MWRGPARESRLSEKREEILKACHCHTGFAPFVGTFDLFFIISLWNLFFHTPIRFSLFLARSFVCSLAPPLNKYWCVLCVLHKLLSGFINLFKRAYMLKSIQKRGRKGERKWFCSFGKMISGYMIIFQLHRYRQVQHYIIVGNLICSFFSSVEMSIFYSNYWIFCTWLGRLYIRTQRFITIFLG